MAQAIWFLSSSPIACRKKDYLLPQFVDVNYKSNEYIPLLAEINSVYDKITDNQPICDVFIGGNKS